jgi:hypothetical protein
MDKAKEADKESIESWEKGIDVLLVYVWGSPLVALLLADTIKSGYPFFCCGIGVRPTVIPTVAARCYRYHKPNFTRNFRTVSQPVIITRYNCF